jgi:hypothetical protein
MQASNVVILALRYALAESGPQLRASNGDGAMRLIYPAAERTERAMAVVANNRSHP